MLFHDKHSIWSHDLSRQQIGKGSEPWRECLLSFRVVERRRRCLQKPTKPELVISAASLLWAARNLVVMAVNHCRIDMQVQPYLLPRLMIRSLLRLVLRSTRTSYCSNSSRDQDSVPLYLYCHVMYVMLVMSCHAFMGPELNCVFWPRMGTWKWPEPLLTWIIWLLPAGYDATLKSSCVLASLIQQDLTWNSDSIEATHWGSRLKNCLTPPQQCHTIIRFHPPNRS
jgi:hypothetical protein